MERRNVNRSVGLPSAMNVPSDGAVYRSIDVSSARAQPLPVRVEQQPVRSKEQQQSLAEEDVLRIESLRGKSAAATAAAAAATTAEGKIKFPRLPVPIQNYPVPTWHTWISDPATSEEDLVAFCEQQLQLHDNCKVTRFQSETSMRFTCVVSGSRCSEKCSFDVSIWDMQEESCGCSGRFLVECERRSGCPFFYNSIMEACFMFRGNCVAPSGSAKSPTHFVVPELPEECKDNGEGCHMECVEKLIQAATSTDVEVRAQACCLLADLLVRDKTIIAKFNQANCKERVLPIVQDSDPAVRRAVQRIISCLG